VTGSGLGLPLRAPAHRVDPAARWLWAGEGLLVTLVAVAVVVVLGIVLPDDVPRWVDVLLVVLRGLLVPLALVAVVIEPLWRYRVHRWEVTEDAVYTRTGWISVHWRIAPISRIQTIDSHRWFGERLFGLANVTATTASAAGPVHIRGLDRGTADGLIETLTAATGQVPGDAT
jgi:membrane protein YdbS with pleckstrin-like domain